MLAAGTVAGKRTPSGSDGKIYHRTDRSACHDSRKNPGIALDLVNFAGQNPG
jgi:hypothetical protein